MAADEDARAALSARFHPPAAALAPFVIDYSIYDSGPAGSHRLVNRYPPGPANICMTFDAGDVRARIRGASYEWRSGSMLFGPTSRAMEVESNGGRLIGIGLTPLGWSRIVPQPARSLADRVVPLATVFDAAVDDAVRAALAAAGDDAAIVAALDGFVGARLGRAGPDEASIVAVEAAILDPAIDSVTGLLARVALPEDRLRRIAGRYFGFPPKVLLRRVRFMRALMTIADRGGDAIDFAEAAPGYHDRSHFIRDAHLFLGMTGRRFLHEIGPFMEAMRRGRRARFGQPLQGLIAAGRDNVLARGA